MTEVTVRKSGGATIISLPKVITELAGISVGSVLDLTVDDHTIHLRPKQEPTLEALLASSPKEKLQLTDEDRTWMDMPSAGKEI